MPTNIRELEPSLPLLIDIHVSWLTDSLSEYLWTVVVVGIQKYLAGKKSVWINAWWVNGMTHCSQIVWSSMNIISMKYDPGRGRALLPWAGLPSFSDNLLLLRISSPYSRARLLIVKSGVSAISSAFTIIFIVGQRRPRLCVRRGSWESGGERDGVAVS